MFSAGNNNTNNIVYRATTDVRTGLVYNDFIVVLTEGDFQRGNTEKIDWGRAISLAGVHAFASYYDIFVFNNCFKVSFRENVTLLYVVRKPISN